MSDTFVRAYTPLNDVQKRDMDYVKAKAEDLLNAVQSASYADPRMTALAKTNLEQAVMWAVKGITNPPIQ